MDNPKCLSLSSVFANVKSCIESNDPKFDNYYLYGEKKETDVDIADRCYLDKPPGEGEDSEEIYPAIVQEKQLEVICSGDILVDVVANALQQKPTVSDMELVEALNYYLHTDSFMVFNSQPAKLQETHFVLAPNMTRECMEGLIEGFGRADLKEFQICSSGTGMLFWTHCKTSEYRPFAQYISIKNGIALNISIYPSKWSHMLYSQGSIASPANYILPGQERKKHPKIAHGPIPDAFISAFPHTDSKVITKYLIGSVFPGHLDGVKVCMNDQYQIGDPKQALDFMRYLGFDF